MPSEYLMKLSDDELSKLYKERCTALDIAEDLIAEVISEQNRRVSEEQSNKTIPVKAIQDLIARWEADNIPPYDCSPSDGDSLINELKKIIQ